MSGFPNMEQDGLMARVSTKILNKMILDIFMKKVCVLRMSQKTVMKAAKQMNSCELNTLS